MSVKTTQFCFKFADLIISQFDGMIYRITDDEAVPIFNSRFSYTTKPDGTYPIDINGDTGDIFYMVITAKSYIKGGQTYPITYDSMHKVQLLAVFSWEDNSVYVSPMSTVAGVFTYARRVKTDEVKDVAITGTKDFRDVAFAMKNNFYETGGAVSKVISSPPNATQTNSYAAFNYLSNIIYYSIVDSQVLLSFINCINTMPNVTVTSCTDAMIGVARHPFENVQQVYDLVAERTQIFYPSLPQIADLSEGFNPVPDQWTLAIKINDSGSQNFLIAGTAFTVFDKENKAWVTNNFRQGTDTSATHCLVFNPDGSPACISPLTGGGILGAGFGVAVSPDGETIAIGNYGWGTPNYNPTTGSVSMFSCTGEVLSPTNGFTNGLNRVQGMCYDKAGNLWMASWGTQEPMADPTSVGHYHMQSQPSAVVCYLGGNHENALIYNNFGDGPSEYHGTFAIALCSDGSVLVSNAGTTKKMPSSLYKIKIADDKKSLQFVAKWDSDWIADPKNVDQIDGFEEFRQPQVDSKGNVYVGGITSGRVVRLDSNLLNPKTTIYNIFGPWGLTFDKKDRKYICGFAEMKNVDHNNKNVEMLGTFGITVVESDDTDWSKSHVMTLPTGGDPVLLANGQPLYGTQLDKNGDQIANSYQPLMRVTATSIDRAGNLWCANNWKPSLHVDAFSVNDEDEPNSNPGGDGVVIFVGIAEPLDSVGI